MYWLVAIYCNKVSLFFMIWHIFGLCSRANIFVRFWKFWRYEQNAFKTFRPSSLYSNSWGFIQFSFSSFCNFVALEPIFMLFLRWNYVARILVTMLTELYSQSWQDSINCLCHQKMKPLIHEFKVLHKDPRAF